MLTTALTKTPNIGLNKYHTFKAKKVTKNEQLAKFSFALSSPIRITILQKLADNSCCYHGDFSEEFSIAKSSLSQHLKILKETGLIQGEINPPKTKYCINKENWALASTLFSDLFNHQ